MEADLLAVLTTICSRVFPTRAEHATPTPYLTYLQYGGEATNYVDAAQPSYLHALMQINVWSDDPQEAKAIARAIEPAMRAASAFTAQPLGAFRDADEPDMELYGASQDFEIWY